MCHTSDPLVLQFGGRLDPFIGSYKGFRLLDLLDYIFIAIYKCFNRKRTSDNSLHVKQVRVMCFYSVYLFWVIPSQMVGALAIILSSLVH